MNARGRSSTSDIMSTTTPSDKFDAAVKVIRSLPKNGSFQPSNEMMLKFYAFYKQATEGQCTAPKPNFWDVVKKAKWEAWHKLGGMSKEEAMCCYVDQLKTIVEAMPQTQLVAEFVEKLGSFYELVDDRTFSEKFSCHDIGCQNGDIPNGNMFDLSENSALSRKVNGNMGHSTNAISAGDPLIDVNSNCARLDVDEMAVRKSDSLAPLVNGPGNNEDDDDNNDDDDDDDDEEDGRIGKEEATDKSIEDKLNLNAVKSDASAFPLHGSQVTSDTDSDVEYCDTTDDLHKSQENVDDGNSVTNGSDTDQVFLSSPVKHNPKMLTKLRKSAGQALARIPPQNNATLINSATPCEQVLVSSTHPFVYIPNRKCSTDSMLVNVPSRQSVSDVDHEYAVTGVLQDDPKCPVAEIVPSNAMMNVTTHGGGEEEEEKPSHKTSRRVSSSGYGATSRNIPRSQSEMSYCPGDQHIRYQVSNTGRAGRPGGEAPEPLRPPSNFTEQIAIALVRLQSDLEIVAQRLDTLEKNSQKDKVSYSWWPFPEVSMKTFFFFALWPIIVHCIFHMASKRKNK